MRRRPEDPPAGGFPFNGKVYQTEVEYRAAVDARDERRARLLAGIYAQRGWDTDGDAEDW
jgi:hypothetical protein